MKSRLFILTLFLIFVSCKAQVIGTLEQFEECEMRSNHDDGCPDLENITYVKDTNNRLNQFVGTWKGNYNSKQYEIKLEKKINYKSEPTDGLSWDMIIGRIKISDNSGNVVYTSMNKPDNDTYFWGYNFQKRSYAMHFVGNYDCLESGDVFIETRLNNPNEMTLVYFQDKDGLLNPAKCPNFNSFVPLLPSQKMTLTKQ
ncbi:MULTISPECIES: DUF6705 family protein [unclassified Chryseobacterium]|uniref:DUF6705 family protein n=1 Tax=unclassified Chryseobacterium TaxID=2593645 RepID=UPI000D362769|nr:MULTISPECIES: DUF6705 family protein [unclassified Chryseobacterium]PTT75995.1 hypothetical protein DBR25_07095 [Chryseobacterium sp. HMWF001]PVV57303.1 hypothetical protein DD829_09070 [Chryseobacterium sp. HMWF035]